MMKLFSLMMMCRDSAFQSSPLRAYSICVLVVNSSLNGFLSLLAHYNLQYVRICLYIITFNHISYRSSYRLQRSRLNAYVLFWRRVLLSNYIQRQFPKSSMFGMSQTFSGCKQIAPWYTANAFTMHVLALSFSDIARCWYLTGHTLSVTSINNHMLEYVKGSRKQVFIKSDGFRAFRRITRCGHGCSRQQRVPTDTSALLTTL